MEGDGAKCNNCHLPNHTVKRCENISCKSAKHWRSEKHKEDREALEKMEKNINDLLKTVKAIEDTLEKRKMTHISVESSINRQIEEILLGEFQHNYIVKGNKNWTKLNRDVAFVKKELGVTTRKLPSLNDVRVIMEQRRQNKSKLPKKRRVNPSIETLSSRGVKFPTFYGSDSSESDEEHGLNHGSLSVARLKTADEEAEQPKMAIKLSKTERNSQEVSTLTRPEDVDEKKGNDSNDDKLIAAKLLLSFKGTEYH